jgi:hypothetical protein
VRRSASRARSASRSRRVSSALSTVTSIA